MKTLALLILTTACGISAPVSITGQLPNAPIAATAAINPCQTTLVPIKSGQGTVGDSTVFKCQSNCSANPFNQISFSSLRASGWTPGQIKAEIDDVEGDTTTPLGCYPLGAGTNPVTVTNGELRLNISGYGCPQKIPQNEVYPIAQNCNTLNINGAIFAFDSIQPGY